GVTNYLSTDLRFSAEVYYKNLWDLIVKPAYGSSAMVNRGKGYACGIDLALLKRFSDKYYGQVNYSYSVSKRKDDNNLALYNSSFNQPHIFNLLVGYQFNDNWSVSGKWKYATGRPRDSYMLHSDALGNPDKLRYSMEITSRNSRRFEDYHALHFRVDYRNQFTDNLALIAYLDIMNLYDRSNGFQDTLNPVTGKIEVEGSSMVPTIGFKVEF
ncbi:MAG: TonB-dependent receptor, partial [Ignavibacteria bacterium]|nr:TonB-dependent receptor [Ignavibacteria bacterium]